MASSVAKGGRKWATVGREVSGTCRNEVGRSSRSGLSAEEVEALGLRVRTGAWGGNTVDCQVGQLDRATGT